MSGAYTRFGFGGACGKLAGVDGEGTGTSQSTGRTTRSAAEIRGRITACFSLAELRRFAEELGVPDIPWERGIQGAAHELVRRFEQRHELGPLVERLRATRPLVEWPDTPTVPSAPSIEPAHTDIPRPAPLPNLSPMPTPSPAPEVPTLAPPAIAPTPRTPNVTGPDPAKARSPGAAAPAHLPAGSQGASARGRGAPRRIDSRLALAALGLVAASLIVAFLIGRASSAPGGEAGRGGAASASAAASSAAPRVAGSPAARPDGVASRAASAIDRRIESLARACEIQPGAAEDVMRRAFERCGPPPTSAARRTAPAQQGDPPAAETPGAPPPSPGAQPRAAAAAGLPPAGGNAGCVGACEQRHKACKATQCGKEPTQSTQYQRYQSCLSDCLEEASKCRLGCL
ncbi:hypothetical protein [Sorangium sp. So ce1000]|uniref:hypothetical protein n=1 Tax=Sorangium sp. So ce1000 TaxID=3133325 RepID=UPI003F5EBE1C